MPFLCCSVPLSTNPRICPSCWYWCICSSSSSHVSHILILLSQHFPTWDCELKSSVARISFSCNFSFQGKIPTQGRRSRRRRSPFVEEHNFLATELKPGIIEERSQDRAGGGQYPSEWETDMECSLTLRARNNSHSSIAACQPFFCSVQFQMEGAFMVAPPRALWLLCGRKENSKMPLLSLMKSEWGAASELLKWMAAVVIKPLSRWWCRVLNVSFLTLAWDWKKSLWIESTQIYLFCCTSCSCSYFFIHYFCWAIVVFHLFSIPSQASELNGAQLMQWLVPAEWQSVHELLWAEPHSVFNCHWAAAPFLADHLLGNSLHFSSRLGCLRIIKVFSGSAWDLISICLYSTRGLFSHETCQFRCSRFKFWFTFVRFIHPKKRRRTKSPSVRRCLVWLVCSSVRTPYLCYYSCLRILRPCLFSLLSIPVHPFL